MAIEKTVRIEESERGKFKIIEQSNGVVVKILQEPSDTEKARLAAKYEASKIQQAAENKKAEARRLVDEEMKRIATENLIKAGKLDKNGELI